MGVGPSVAYPQQRDRAHTTRSDKNTRRAARLSCPDYMTHYDVKQLMRDMNRNRDDVPNRNNEEDPLAELHQQFCGVVKKDSIRSVASQDSDASRASDASRVSAASHQSDASRKSHDSGIESAQLSVDCMRSYMEAEVAELSVASTNETISAEVSPVFARPLKTKGKRRFLPKRVFGRKGERTRSKSLGADQKFGVECGDKPGGPLFGGSSLLNREWELVTMSEMYRRLSLDELDQMEMPIPQGAADSQILDELMIRQVMEILPPRAESYPWVNIYSSEKNGFSLTTLYRKMVEFDEDLSPVLLIIRDTNEHVFGAVVSGAIRPSEHYTGFGDSCKLWRFTGVAPHTRELRVFNWTGENQFFVSAAKDALSIGAGGGHNGLWLDADLNHGRSQRCDTFDNEPLSGEKEDFIIQFVEAFGFRE